MSVFAVPKRQTWLRNRIGIRRFLKINRILLIQKKNQFSALCSRQNLFRLSKYAAFPAYVTRSKRFVQIGVYQSHVGMVKYNRYSGLISTETRMSMDQLSMRYAINLFPKIFAELLPVNKRMKMQLGTTFIFGVRIFPHTVWGERRFSTSVARSRRYPLMSVYLGTGEHVMNPLTRSQPPIERCRTDNDS